MDETSSSKKAIGYLKKAIYLIWSYIVFYIIFQRLWYLIKESLIADIVFDLCVRLLIVGLLVLAILTWKVKTKIDIVSLKNNIINWENLFLFGVVLWFGISIIWNQSTNNNVNVQDIRDFESLAIKVFILYLFPQLFDDNRKFLNIIFNLIIGCTTIIVFYVLINICFFDEIMLSNGGRVYFFEGRLWLNAHHNTSGMAEKTIIIMCAYMFICTAKKSRWLYFFAGLVHYTILSLTDSRGAILAVALCMALIVMLLSLKNDRFKSRAYRIKTAAWSIIVYCMFYYGRFLVQKVYNLIRIADVVTDQDRGLYNLNSRTIFMKAGIKSLSDAKVALWGVLPENVPSLLKIYTGRKVEYYSHNEFIEIACSIGLIGLVFFLIWLFIVAFKCCYRLLKGDIKSKSIVILILLCISELVNNLIEACLTVHDYFSGMIFYFTAGYVVFYLRKLKKDRKINE